MAKAKKLKSGSWRVLVYDYTDQDGKRHYQSFTADTKAKAEFKAAEFAAGRTKQSRKPSDITVLEAIDKYIELSEVLSPTTLQGYEKIKKFAFQGIMDIKVKDLDDTAMQVAINMEAKRKAGQTGKQLSPKTVKNEWGLLSSALRQVCGRTYSIKLPTIQKKVPEYPEPGVVLQAIIGSSIELPCLLAMWLSFSLSEIRGLTCSSIRDGYIYIDKVMVDVDGVPKIKENAKVDTRLRKHQIPDYIMQLIKAQDTWTQYQETGQDQPLINLTVSQLRTRWQRLCRNNGFTMSFHGLRHMNASIMMLLNIPEKYAMERGGWKTPYVMKSVYQHTFSDERKQVDQTVNDYFGKLLNATQTCNTKTEKR